MENLVKDRFKAEAVLRATICAFISYVLSIAYLPNAVPTGLTYLVGIMGVVFALAFPKPLFALGVVVPGALVLVTLSLLASSMVLSAASVSDGFLVFIFAIYTLFMTSLYTGKSFDKTGGSAIAYIVIPGLLSLSFREGVQTLGLELIKLTWTESGLSNPLAVNRNILISICWALVAYVIAVILPPFRTARATLTRSLLPLIYKQIVAVLTGETKNYGALIHFWNSLGQGAIAKLTLFEPRIFLSWTEDLVTPLTDLIVQTDHLLIASIIFQNVKLVGQDGPEEAVMKENVLLVNLCAGALASNDATDLMKVLFLRNQKRKPPPLPLPTYSTLKSSLFVSLFSPGSMLWNIPSMRIPPRAK
eukprot:scaffold3307_cov47-Attheya_sp.AAC.2